MSKSTRTLLVINPKIEADRTKQFYASIVSIGIILHYSLPIHLPYLQPFRGVFRSNDIIRFATKQQLPNHDFVLR
jgi:hypothetical protein